MISTFCLYMQMPLISRVIKGLRGRKILITQIPVSNTAVDRRGQSVSRFGSKKLLLILVSWLIGLCSIQQACVAEGPPTVAEYAALVPNARIVPFGSLVLDGYRLTCGRRPTVLDPSLDDYGAAYPGFLILNPNLIARVPTAVKLWIFSHECGHQFRGPSEELADCFAVQRGRRQRWLTTEGLDKICDFITPARGSIMHLSGPERCKLMRKCYAAKKVY